MLISKYTHEKQKLLEAQGVVISLVPENQIDDTIEQKPLDFSYEGGICPYCQIFGEDECRGCPMYEAGNSCSRIGSTYHRVVRELGGSIITIPGIQELVDKYNEELGDDYENNNEA